MIAMTLLETIRGTMAAPSSNQTVAFVLLALVTLAVLLTLVLLLLAYTRPAPAKYEDPPLDADERTDAFVETAAAADDYEYPELVPDEITHDTPAVDAGKGHVGDVRERRRIGGALIAIAVVVALSVISMVATSTDRYCTDTCHAHRASVSAHARDAHAAVACVTCHEDPSLLGALDAPFARTGHALRGLSSEFGSQMAPVSSTSCLGCHRGIRGRTVTVTGFDIRMSHDAPLAAGMACGDCHSRTGHDSGPPIPPRMATCAPCHNGKTAASLCATCHPANASRARRPSDARRAYTSFKLQPMTECGACHDQTACDSCHGIRLPHTAEFKAWSHARGASFDRRKVCQGCHTTSDCTACHPGMKVGVAPSHPADWKTSHQTQPRTSACDCHWQRLPDAGRAQGGYCQVCH